MNRIGFDHHNQPFVTRDGREPTNIIVWLNMEKITGYIEGQLRFWPFTGRYKKDGADSDLDLRNKYPHRIDGTLNEGQPTTLALEAAGRKEGRL